MFPFYAMAELEQTAQPKGNGTNINTKAGPPNRHISLTLNSSFLYESRRPSFGQHHQY